MAKKSQAEFVKWFGPLLDALRDLGDSGRPREVSARIAKNMNLSDQVLDETLMSVITIIDVVMFTLFDGISGDAERECSDRVPCRCWC